MEIETIIGPNWIYDFSDYNQMYDLTAVDFKKKILDFSAGISSFNAQAHAQHYSVISLDAAYHFSAAQMKAHAQQLLQTVIAQLKEEPLRLQNASSAQLQQVMARWEKTQNVFLKDYETGRLEKRYQPIVLPTLPFATQEFQLALCTNFIFHHAFSQKKIQTVLQELARVADEVRVFPLLNSSGKMPDELGPLMLYFQQKKYGIEVREVAYHTLKGGNAMLRIWQQECVV